MPMISKSFDLQCVEWRRVTDPNCKSFDVDFEYSLLGYDVPSGRRPTPTRMTSTAARRARPFCSR